MKWIPIRAGDLFLYGLYDHPDAGFCRMPRSVVEAVTKEAIRPTVQALYTTTSGGRLRLVTDSQVIALRVQLGAAYFGGRSTFLGTSGFDVYQNTENGWQYAGCLVTEDTTQKDYEVSLRFGTSKQRELLFYFPLYSEVKSIQLGLEDSSVLMPSPDYRSGKKVVFYGSSITQGGCTPRPGMNYPAILSRRLDFDFVNLGFSDGARAEPSMVKYLCSLPMDVLVCDYDHNAIDPEYLRNTHLKMYQTIREQRPELPIIIASAPVAHLDNEFYERREIILKTFQYARDNGDTRIEFVDGAAMYPPECREECSIDRIHPNGLGMYYMANAFEPALARMLSY